MKILVISQYYHPEPGATSNRLKSFVDAMIKRGHEVTVICEFPNHPSGMLAPGDRWRLFRVEDHGTHKIIRTFVLTSPQKSNIKRMLFYLSFSLSSFMAALFIKKHDLVFASSPPIFHVFTAMIIAGLKKSEFILDIRDIWPDIALEFDAVTNRHLLKWGGYLERKLYNNARVILTTTKGQKRTVEIRGGSGKAIVSYNGSDDDILNWPGDIKKLRKSLGWENKIVVCYAGLIGLGQNLTGLLPEISRIDGNNITFVFIGNGPGEYVLKSDISKTGLKNIEIRQMMPRSDVIPLIYASDIMIVILRESSFFNSTIPSKVFDYMAAGKPIITNVDGELREIVINNNAGLYFSLKEKGSFADAVQKLKDNFQLRNTMGSNGKKLVSEKFMRSKLNGKTIEYIENSVQL